MNDRILLVTAALLAVLALSAPRQATPEATPVPPKTKKQLIASGSNSRREIHRQPRVSRAERIAAIEVDRHEEFHRDERRAEQHQQEHQQQEVQRQRVVSSREEPAAPEAPAPPTASSDQAFVRLATCESGMRNTTNPSGKYRGYFQFDLQTWRSIGMAGDPLDHSWEQQLHAAKLLHSQRGWSPWPQCSRSLGLR